MDLPCATRLSDVPCLTVACRLSTVRGANARNECLDCWMVSVIIASTRAVIVPFTFVVTGAQADADAAVY